MRVIFSMGCFLLVANKGKEAHVYWKGFLIFDKDIHKVGRTEL